MKWGKRILLFVATNIAIIATISILTSVLGLRGWMTSQGLDYSRLMAYCLLWGMTGSVFSLLISRMVAKWSMGVQLIEPTQAGGEERWLLETVYRLAKRAGIETMPEVGIYDSPEVNAFATGPSQNRALVAVSSGLLRTMRRDEVEGVLAHEVAHVANGDMVTMTLVQGVVNAFVMFIARVVAWGVSQALAGNRDDEESSSPGFAYYMIVLALEIVLGLFGSMIVAWFSRYREFRADEGGAKLGGRAQMISALSRLQSYTDAVDTQHAAMASMKIAGRPGGFLALFSTHPPLEERIEALRKANLT